MKDDFWSWGNLRPANFMELLFGIVVLIICIMMLFIVTDVFIREHLR